MPPCGLMPLRGTRGEAFVDPRSVGSSCQAAAEASIAGCEQWWKIPPLPGADVNRYQYLSKYQRGSGGFLDLTTKFGPNKQTKRLLLLDSIHTIKSTTRLTEAVPEQCWTAKPSEKKWKTHTQGICHLIYLRARRRCTSEFRSDPL